VPRDAFISFTHQSLSFSLSLCLAATPCAAQQVPAIDSLISERMTREHIPGLAVAVVDSGRVIWTGTYGFAEVAARRPVTDSTPFQLASVSKPITATILLSLYAAGRFALDDDINRYLPFPVRNPAHPGVPITFRQLLIHRSSIADNRDYFRPFWSESHGDNTMPLETFLRDYLTPNGKNYSKEKNFLPAAPGEQFRYCNTCYALLGYLAQRISGRPFEQFSREILFQPLGMNETAWFIRDFTSNSPAVPHRFAKDTGFVAGGQNGYPDWPAGTLRSSIRDVARFLSVYVQDGSLNGKAVIPVRVIQSMAPDDPHLGFLTWFLEGTSTREILYAHEGGDTGVRTYMGFTHRGKRGVIVLTNGEASVLGIAEAVFIRIGEIEEATRHRP
jgi:CubicO group peptidase (beta-lactamase class C family)